MSSVNTNSILPGPICFFGASVTKQKTGYARVYENLYASKVNPTHVFGYGGMTIFNAGICFIDQIIKIKPTYCFIEFFSSAWLILDDLFFECIDTLVYKLTHSNCRIVFLFVVNVDNGDYKNRRNLYRVIKKYLDTKRISYIDLNDHFNYSKDIIRDDTVHTTDCGAELYATKIHEIFKTMDVNFPTYIDKTKYCTQIKCLLVNKIFTNTITLQGDCLIIGCLLNIGPHSGFIEINNTVYETWDPWCYYNRKHITLQWININKNNKVNINVLQTPVDYSGCCKQFDFTTVSKKELHIKTIFYIGEQLEIVSSE